MDNPSPHIVEERIGRMTSSSRSSHSQVRGKRALRLRRSAVACVGVLALLTLAACGGSDSSKEPAAATGTNKATGTPIKIGLLNPANGAATAPGTIQGTTAGTKFVNGDLGGVDNHPIEVVSCDVDVTAPESNINCANQFAKDGVVAVIDAFNPSASAALPILQSAGIPMIGPVPYDPAVGSAPEDRVYFGPAPAAFLLGAMQSLKQQGFSSIALANLDIPSGHETIDKLLVPLGKQIGMDVKAVYFPAANPNYSVLASSLKSTDAEVAGLLVTLGEPMCSNLFQAMVNVGFKGVQFMASCSEFINKLGAKAVGAETYSSIWLPQAEDSAPADVQKHLDVAKQYVSAESGPGDWNAYSSFATIVDFAQTVAAAKLTEYSGETVLKALKGIKDYQSYLGPVLNCGVPTSPNCTTEIYNFKVVSPGKTEAVGGSTIQPDEQALKAIPGAN